MTESGRLPIVPMEAPHFHPCTMLVQPRGDTVRLFTQHDHGLMCGDLAHAWRMAPWPDGPPRWIVQAAALHDLAWTDRDAAPRWCAETGGVESFTDLRPHERGELYAAGLDRVEAIEPAAAVVCSLHYSAFVPDDQGAFAAGEAARRARLAHTTGLSAERDEVTSGLELVRALDLLSLAMCLTAPGSDEGSAPTWVHRPARVGGREIVARFVADDVVVLDPFPLVGSVELRIPFRDVSTGATRDAARLADAWRDAAPNRWHLRVTGAR